MSSKNTEGDELVSCGIDVIDEIRRNALSCPTDTANVARRQSLLFTWVRLLVHRRIDIREFEPVAAEIAKWGVLESSKFAKLDEAFSVLNRIEAAPIFIEEVSGIGRNMPAAAPVDWPEFQGTRCKTGYTMDPGPSTGRIAWKHPVGMSWYASAAVSEGRVYVASPGLTTLMRCFDEQTGELIWETPQDGLQVYSTPRASSTVLVVGDRVIMRATSGSWEPEEKVACIYCIDRASGRIVSRIEAERVDYRRGCAPIGDNGEFLVFPWSRLDLRGAPAVVQMQDTVVVKRVIDGSHWWSFRVGEMFGEPVIAQDLVVVPVEDGRLHALHLLGPQRMAWVCDLGSALRSTPAIVGNIVLVGTEDGWFHGIELGTGRVLWKSQICAGEPRAFQLFSRASVSDGRAWVGTATKELVCLAVESGEVLWRCPTGDWVRARPLVVGESVITADWSGQVIAHDFDGNTLWSISTGGHPILADLSGNQNGVLASASDLFLHSIDPKTGTVRWRQSLLRCVYEGDRRILADVVAGGGDYESPPVVADGRVLVGGPDRCVHAVDRTSGKLLWRFETSGQVSGCVTVRNGRAYFGQQGGDRRFHCVDARTGAPVWETDVGWVWTSATVAEGRVFTGTVEGEIVALDAVCGAGLWTRKTNGGIYPAPAFEAGVVFTGSWDGYYYALDAGNGAIRWCWAAEGWDYRRGGGPDSAAAILCGDKLICRTFPQTLTALDKRTGEVRWHFRDESRLVPKMGMNATPSCAGNRIFVSTTTDHDGMPVGGRLFCVDAESGKLRWFYEGAGGWTGSACSRDQVICASSTDVFVTSLSLDPDERGRPRIRWRTRVSGLFQETIPAISGLQAFILCTDGYLYAFE